VQLGIWLGLAGLAMGAAPPEKIDLMLDWFPNPNHVPIYAAQVKGYFGEEGLAVAILPPADPTDPMKLTAAGKVDVAINYLPNVILARSQGLPVTSIGLLVEPGIAVAMALKESGITSVRDLKGKTVGYAVAPFNPIIFEAMADQVGLKKGDYELINIGFNLIPALLAKKVHAVIGVLTNYETIRLEMEGKEAVIFRPEDHGVPERYQLIFIANEGTLERRPGVLKRFIRAAHRGIQFALERPDEALELFFKLHPHTRNDFNRRAFQATLPVYARAQVQQEGRWLKYQDFLLQRGVIKAKSEPGKLYTNRFAP
jgi:putative hydroxymethylpyrimidine transport system substrate-binding protein